MTRHGMKQVPVFWGCTFVHNYPFLINSTKKVLKHLGVEPVDIENAGCCPDPVYVRAWGKDLQLALSARNLSLAGKKDSRLLVVCNGCFNILNGANKELKNHKLREKINSFLPAEVRYDGGLEVIHILEKLASEIGVLKSLVKRPVTGLKVAVHYGCHTLYPPAVSTDNPANPKSLDQIVEAVGAESVEYEGKLDCCGAPSMAFDVKEADRLLQYKLTHINGKADCIVTTCPGCFLRFDMPPAGLRDLSTPVIHLSELLCLAFGLPPKELFLEGHVTDVSHLFEKIGLTPLDDVKKYFDIEVLESHCGACSKECTAAVRTQDMPNPFDPLDTVKKLLDGKFYEVIRGKEIWRCLQCGKCEMRCPNNVGLKEMFAKLRELAVEDGNLPRMVSEKKKMLEKTGYAMPIRISIRKKMGIEPAPQIETKEVRLILDKIGGGKNAD